MSTFLVPAYLLARGATRGLRTSVSVPLHFIGTRSLEFYLLQFHLFLAKGAQALLTIVPWKLVNLAL
eukprot:2584003-Prymnesium_polylepis.2